MNVSMVKRVVIEMTPEEASKFYREHHPAKDSIGKDLDKALWQALEDYAAWA